MADVTIRPLQAADWQSFRAMRLLALKSAPGVFYVSHDEAARWTDADWQAQAQSPAHQVFGLFAEDSIIGITGVFTDRRDPEGRTALLAMSFIHPGWRGRGLSRLFYEARLAWVRERPHLRKVVVSHRRSNEASRAANQHHGFVAVKTAPLTWPDGAVEDEIFYELAL